MTKGEVASWGNYHRVRRQKSTPNCVTCLSYEVQLPYEPMSLS